MPRPTAGVGRYRVVRWGGLAGLAACATWACAPARTGAARPGGAAQAGARQPRCTDDSVSVGYGSQRRCDVTASVGSMALDTQTAQSSATLADVLRARVPGLDVFTGPGGQLSLRVRGGAGGGFRGGEPLLVVDGMPVEGAVGGALAALEPRDVARVDVLKDAGSAAVYGSRAANGVVLITTRRR